MGELLDQCEDKDGPATTSVVSPNGWPRGRVVLPVGH